MPFRSLVAYALKCNQIGWFATRQQMLKNGASYKDLAHVLVFRLNILGELAAK